MQQGLGPDLGELEGGRNGYGTFMELWIYIYGSSGITQIDTLVPLFAVAY